MMSSPFLDKLRRRKSIEELRKEAVSDTGFKRALTAIDLIAIGMGAIIGAGIFVLTGQAAANYAGPAIVFSFLLAALACGFAGLCYAEFASMIPISGSAYTYSYATLGEFVAWFIGWDLLIEYSLGAAAVSVGWSGYVVAFLDQVGLSVPAQLTAPPGTKLVFLSNQLIRGAGLSLPAGWHQWDSYAHALQQSGVSLAALPQSVALFNLPACLIVILLTALLVRGIKESAIFNATIVTIKLVVIIAVILVGASSIIPSNWIPFVPPNSGKFGEFGWSGVARGAAVVFFAYIGFDSVSTVAQEARNPQRDMPIGILGSLVVCTILYILVALVITGVVPYPRLNVADPVAVAMDATGVRWLAFVVKLGAIAGLTSVILVLLMGQPRILFSMARDGLLPQFFAKIHPRFHTPARTTILTGSLVAVIASLIPIQILGELVSIGTLAAFTVVCAGILALRYQEPDAPRPFRVPWVPLTPLMGVASCLGLALSLPPEAWARFLIWLILGLIVYFLYGAKHSHSREGHSTKSSVS
jgi:APA family basic amino acid/polyamine antiporter